MKEIVGKELVTELLDTYQLARITTFASHPATDEFNLIFTFNPDDVYGYADDQESVRKHNEYKSLIQNLERRAIKTVRVTKEKQYLKVRPDVDLGYAINLGLNLKDDVVTYKVHAVPNKEKDDLLVIVSDQDVRVPPKIVSLYSLSELDDETKSRIAVIFSNCLSKIRLDVME
jgi:hypothetical protein